MTQYKSLNVKLSDSQLDKLKSAIKNETEVVLRLSSNIISNSNDEPNFPHKYYWLILTAAASAADAGIHNTALWIYNANNIKWWNGRHYENS